jgi:HEAT repeat protein
LAAWTVAALIAAVGVNAGPGAYAQGAMTGEPNTGQAGKKVTDKELLEDFIHYVRIANYELAASKGQELINRNLKNGDFVKLVESGDVGRFTETTQRALQSPVVQPVAASLIKAYDTGLLERARDPNQIAKNIQDLLGNARTKSLAQQRLLAAGEYAMPQLTEALLNNAKPQLQAEVTMVIRNLGRQAVIPLSTAMMKVPPAQQELIADVLGLINYRSSVPFLNDVAQHTKVAAVRNAATRAIDRLGGAPGDTPALYRSLAESYYAEKSELTSFPGEDFQLLWSYNPSANGLIPTAIRTPVFHEAMAMSLLERGMELESATGGVNPDTLALWVASNFHREIQTPQGYANPAYPVAGSAPQGVQPMRSAEYFGVASGADIDQRVLARALDNKDTPLARKALAAAEQTAGGRNLWNATGGRNPLLEAIGYPNRRVQYEAALALAAAQPQSPFSGSERVVPTLASSIRGASTQYAAVVASDAEAYQGMRRVLTGLGYTVMPQGRTLSDLEQTIAEAPAVDLIVGLNQNADKVPALIEQVRNWAKIAATPVLVMTSPESYVSVRRRYDNDPTVAVRQTGISGEALNKTVTDLVNTASGGPITEQEAHQYAQRSLGAMRDLAVSGNQVLNVSDAALPLIGALGDPNASSKMQVAEILSRIGQERAQRAVMDAALAAKGPDRIALMGMVSESAKRFGNLLEPREVAQVVEIAGKGADDEATAAASLMGALNLPNNELVGVILKRKS